MTWEELVAADPDVIDHRALRLRSRAHRAGDVLDDRAPRLDASLRARVYLADGNQYFNRPGPRVVETLRHPRARSCIPIASSQRFAASAWRAL